MRRKKFRAENPHSRVVLRSGNNSSANSGLAYANANNACSNSNTNYGARLNLLRLNRVTLQGNEIVKVFREGFEPLATATHCAGKPKNDNNLRMWSVAPATSTGPEGSNIETMDAETAHNIKYDLIPQECSNLPAALRHAGFPIDNILDEIVSATKRTARSTNSSLQVRRCKISLTRLVT